MSDPRPNAWLLALLLWTSVVSGCGEPDPGGVLRGRIHTPSRLGLPGTASAYEPELRIRWMNPDTGKREYRWIGIERDGTWRATDLPLGIDLEVKLPNQTAMDAGCVPIKPAVVRAGDRLTWNLVPGVEITGKCLPAKGQDAPIYAWALARALGQQVASRHVGFLVSKDGSFVARGLERGRYRVEFRRTSSSQRRPNTVALLGAIQVKAPATSVEFQLPETETLRVEIRGLASRYSSLDVSLFEVGTTILRASAFGSMTRIERSEDAPDMCVVRFPAVPKGEYDLVVEEDGAAQSAFRGTISTGHTVGVTLQPAKTLSGALRRADGRSDPFHGRLYAVREGAVFDLMIDGDGTFGSKLVAPGAYDLHYVEWRGASRRTTVIARDREAGTVDLDLRFDLGDD